MVPRRKVVFRIISGLAICILLVFIVFFAWTQTRRRQIEQTVREIEALYSNQRWKSPLNPSVRTPSWVNHPWIPAPATSPFRETFYGVQFADLPIKDSELAPLAALPRVESISMVRTKVNGSFLRTLRDPHALVGLHLEGSPVTPDAWDILPRFKNLRALILTGVSVNDDVLALIGTLEQLVYLRLDGGQISDAGLQHLEGLVKLKELSVSGESITNAATASLSNLTLLTELSLSRTSIDHEGLEFLTKMPGLKNLSLNDTNVDRRAVPSLSKLKQLRQLYIKGTKLSEEAITQLSKSLPNCHIYWENGYIGPDRPDGIVRSGDVSEP